MFILLVTSMLTLASNIKVGRSSPTTITVPDDYPTIQEAIYRANEGDTVYVRNGTYSENVVVSKDNLTLIGENRSNTIIDGKGTGSVVIISANNVIMRYFTIRNSAAYESGIYIGYNYAGNVVQSNIITNDYCGISVLSSDNITALGNKITNNEYGFYMVQSSENGLVDNVITNNVRGISLDLCYNNTVTNNRIEESSVFGIGVYRSSNNMIDRNTFTNNSLGIRLWGVCRHVVKRQRLLQQQSHEQYEPSAE
jgi:parallel beta-helix repeat protein